MPTLGHLSSARTASLRVTQQEYESLQLEARQHGYNQLSALLRFYLFGKAKRFRNVAGPETEMTRLGDILGKLTILSGALGTNGIHIAAIAKTLDQGFRDAFGLDFCLRLSERLSEDIFKTLNLINELVLKQQKLLKRRRRDQEE